MTFDLDILSFIIDFSSCFGFLTVSQIRCGFSAVGGVWSVCNTWLLARTRVPPIKVCHLVLLWIHSPHVRPAKSQKNPDSPRPRIPGARWHGLRGGGLVHSVTGASAALGSVRYCTAHPTSWPYCQSEHLISSFQLLVAEFRRVYYNFVKIPTSQYVIIVTFFLFDFLSHNLDFVMITSLVFFLSKFQIVLVCHTCRTFDISYLWLFI